MYQIPSMQHQQLIKLLDQLELSVLKSASINQLSEQISQIINLAALHFQNQEAVINKHHFIETSCLDEIYRHSKEHNEILHRLQVLADKLIHHRIPFKKCYINLFRIWLEIHLVDSDNRLDMLLYPHRIKFTNRTKHNKAKLVDVYLEF